MLLGVIYWYIYGSAVLLLDLRHFFSFLILYTASKMCPVFHFRIHVVREDVVRREFLEQVYIFG
jgi:hypothetical protein